MIDALLLVIGALFLCSGFLGVFRSFVNSNGKLWGLVEDLYIGMLDATENRRSKNLLALSGLVSFLELVYTNDKTLSKKRVHHHSSPAHAWRISLCKLPCCMCRSQSADICRSTLNRYREILVTGGNLSGSESAVFHRFQSQIVIRRILKSGEVWSITTSNVNQTQDRREVDAVPCDFAVPRHRIYKQPCIA